MKFRMVILISSVLLISVGFVPGVKAVTFSDVFPAALSNYVYGGWQGPFGDGTAGRLFPTSDSTGIYMDATYNGYVWALRSSPEFANIDMTMQFILPTRDGTDADHFAVFLLLHGPTTPPSGNCTTVCPEVAAQSGLSVRYQVGRNQLWVVRFIDGVGSVISQVSLPPVALNQPHDARATYTEGTLKVYLDGLQLLDMQTPDVPAGQVAFSAYRVDMIVNSVTLVSASAPQLSVSLTGNFDYLLQESIRIQIAALVTDASTGQTVSGADVAITVVDSSGNPVFPSTPMTERTSATGIYVWTSNATIQKLHLAKGIYLAHVTASSQGGPEAHAILSFHIDPPSDTSFEPSVVTISALAAAAAASVAAAGIVMKRLRRTARVS